MPVTQRLGELLQRLWRELSKLPLWRRPVPRPPWSREIGWRVVAAAALLGGIVHICATFAAPLLPPAFPLLGASNAYDLLREKLPPNRMVVLPQQAPGRQILPYLPPDMLYAMCRYELTGGPVAVTAVVADAGWALSLHTLQGANFYALPGQHQRGTEVSLLVVPSGFDATLAPRREGDTHITSPAPEGLIVLRGPRRGRAWTAQAEATLQRATCTQVKQ